MIKGMDNAGTSPSLATCRKLAAVLAAATLLSTGLFPPLATADPDTDPSASATEQVDVGMSRNYLAVDREKMLDFVHSYYSLLGTDAATLAEFDRHYQPASTDPLVDDYYGILFGAFAQDLSESSPETANLLQEIYGQCSELAVTSTDGVQDDLRYRSYEDPDFLDGINRKYAKRLYKAFAELGILDDELINHIGYIPYKGSDFQWHWERYQDGDSEYSKMFSGLDSWDGSATYYAFYIPEEHGIISNPFRTDRPDLTGTAKVRDLFDLNGAGDVYPWTGYDTGSGITDMSVVSGISGEYGGTAEPATIPNPDDPDGPEIDNPFYNPDNSSTDGGNTPDGLGDNLAFTVPSSINFVAKSDGDLIGPDNAYIENRSAVPIHASSLKTQAVGGWQFATDDEFGSTGSASAKTDKVNIKLSPVTRNGAGHGLDLIDYSNGKLFIDRQSEWSMDSFDGIISNGSDTVALGFNGKIGDLTKDITQRQKFAEVRWYMTAGTSAGWLDLPREDAGGYISCEATVAEGFADNASDALATFETRLGTLGVSVEDYICDDNPDSKCSAINGKPLVFITDKVQAESGDWLTLHLSNGKSVEVIAVADMSGDIAGMEHDADDAFYSYSDDSQHGVSVVFRGTMASLDDASAPAAGAEDFSRFGYPGARILEIENHGQAPELS